MATTPAPDYSSVVSATGFLRPRASRSISDFQTHLAESPRVLALLGAGLSAPSGLPTFRGTGGLWRTHDAKQLSTPQAFDENPGLVWEFYLERRAAAKEAKPNRAHFALSELAKRVPGFMAISMNIDGLSERATHPPAQISFLHGSLFSIRCTTCPHTIHDEAAEAVITTLPTALASSSTSYLSAASIPICPACHTGLLRPGVVWFGEALPSATLASLYAWIEAAPSIDTMLVIGTSAEVYPATAYIEAARKKLARVAVVNAEQEDPGLLGLEEQDWYFQGDAEELVPEMLKEVVGEIRDA
ncbi:DHS-like NAD/FAD-binding domain-containing protein [Mytilinidion resinicola]|uniref:DHS-like NAD/FAD-binding domain-containing protein n=1 Tax=Mytilinidion resinicola TaxID=574789 RepID=A0A6A6ZB44_9PEZI|nr:DHS-like NAD/FAD-binding domain-containing protein [Mytilinidion resinicola]KAF2817437.1 DHS-like NAD/FAD-binding domain-containing protein [Mytilinidion resinicola]